MDSDKDTGLKKYTYDILLGIIIVIHLLTRDWPFGGTAQTVTDVLIVVALILTAIRYVTLHRSTKD